MAIAFTTKAHNFANFDPYTVMTKPEFNYPQEQKDRCHKLARMLFEQDYCKKENIEKLFIWLDKLLSKPKFSNLNKTLIRQKARKDFERDNGLSKVKVFDAIKFIISSNPFIEPWYESFCKVTRGDAVNNYADKGYSLGLLSEYRADLALNTIPELSSIDQDLSKKLDQVGVDLFAVDKQGNHFPLQIKTKGKESHSSRQILEGLEEPQLNTKQVSISITKHEAELLREQGFSISTRKRSRGEVIDLPESRRALWFKRTIPKLQIYGLTIPEIAELSLKYIWAFAEKGYLGVSKKIEDMNFVDSILELSKNRFIQRTRQ